MVAFLGDRMPHAPGGPVAERSVALTPLEQALASMCIELACLVRELSDASGLDTSELELAWDGLERELDKCFAQPTDANGTDS